MIPIWDVCYICNHKNLEEMYTSSFQTASDLSEYLVGHSRHFHSIARGAQSIGVELPTCVMLIFLGMRFREVGATTGVREIAKSFICICLPLPGLTRWRPQCLSSDSSPPSSSPSFPFSSLLSPPLVQPSALATELLSSSSTYIHHTEPSCKGYSSCSSCHQV